MYLCFQNNVLLWFPALPPTCPRQTTKSCSICLFQCCLVGHCRPVEDCQPCPQMLMGNPPRQKQCSRSAGVCYFLGRGTGSGCQSLHRRHWADLLLILNVLLISIYFHSHSATVHRKKLCLECRRNIDVSQRSKGCWTIGETSWDNPTHTKLAGAPPRPNWLWELLIMNYGGHGISFSCLWIINHANGLMHHYS